MWTGIIQAVLSLVGKVLGPAAGWVARGWKQHADSEEKRSNVLEKQNEVKPVRSHDDVDDIVRKRTGK